MAARIIANVAFLDADLSGCSPARGVIYPDSEGRRTRTADVYAIHEACRRLNRAAKFGLLSTVLHEDLSALGNEDTDKRQHVYALLQNILTPKQITQLLKTEEGAEGLNDSQIGFVTSLADSVDWNLVLKGGRTCYPTLNQDVYAHLMKMPRNSLTRSVQSRFIHYTKTQDNEWASAQHPFVQQAFQYLQALNNNSSTPSPQPPFPQGYNLWDSLPKENTYESMGDTAEHEMLQSRPKGTKRKMVAYYETCTEWLQELVSRQLRILEENAVAAGTSEHTHNGEVWSLTVLLVNVISHDASEELADIRRVFEHKDLRKTKMTRFQHEELTGEFKSQYDDVLLEVQQKLDFRRSNSMDIDTLTKIQKLHKALRRNPELQRKEELHAVLAVAKPTPRVTSGGKAKRSTSKVTSGSKVDTRSQTKAKAARNTPAKAQKRGNRDPAPSKSTPSSRRAASRTKKASPAVATPIPPVFERSYAAVVKKKKATTRTSAEESSTADASKRRTPAKRRTSRTVAPTPAVTPVVIPSEDELDVVQDSASEPHESPSPARSPAPPADTPPSSPSPRDSSEGASSEDSSDDTSSSDTSSDDESDSSDDDSESSDDDSDSSDSPRHKRKKRSPRHKRKKRNKSGRKNKSSKRKRRRPRHSRVSLNPIPAVTPYEGAEVDGRDLDDFLDEFKLSSRDMDLRPQIQYLQSLLRPAILRDAITTHIAVHKSQGKPVKIKKLYKVLRRTIYSKKPADYHSAIFHAAARKIGEGLHAFYYRLMKYWHNVLKHCRDYKIPETMVVQAFRDSCNDPDFCQYM